MKRGSEKESDGSEKESDKRVYVETGDDSR